MRTLCRCLLLMLPALADPSKVSAAQLKIPPGDFRPEDVIRVLATPAFRHASGVQCAAASGDGKYLVTGTKDGAVLWDAGNGKKIKVLVGGNIRCLDLVGTMIAVGSEDGSIAVFDLVTGKQRIALKHPGAYPTWLALSPDGSLLALSRDAEIQLWNIATGKQTDSLKGHADIVGHAVFGPKGKSLFSVSADGTMREWNLKAGKETRRWTLEPDWFAVALGISADGKSLGVLVNSAQQSVVHVRVLEVSTFHERFRAAAAGQFGQCVHLSKDGRFVAAAFQCKSPERSHIPIWDTLTGKLTRLEPETTPTMSNVQFLPDGKTLATGGDDGCVRLWDIATGKQHASTQGICEPITGLAWAPTGRVVASTGPSGVVQFWDAGKGTALHRLDKRSLDHMAFSPDGHYVLTLEKVDFNAETRGSSLWDTRTGKKKHTFEKVFRCAAFAPDGKTLAAGDDQNGLRLWEVATGLELRYLAGHILRVNAIAFSSDGAMLASASEDGIVCLWNVATGKWLGCHATECRQLWFSADGSLLFVSHFDAFGVNIYETLTGKKVFALTDVKKNAQGQILTGLYPSTRGAFALAHGGATLVFARGSDKFGTIDMVSGQTLGPDIAYGGQFTTAEFSADGKTLALGYEDGGLVLCKPPPLPPRKPLPATMETAKLTHLWQVLAEPDAQAAYQARWWLSAASKQTLTLFRQKLRPQKADAKQVAAWIGQLDSRSFKEREFALMELDKAGDAVEGALQKALERNPSLETKLRIELLLAKLGPLATGSTLRTLRAIVILEAVGSDEARAILRDLAGGAPGARVTEAAQKALKRMM